MRNGGDAPKQKPDRTTENVSLTIKKMLLRRRRSSKDAV